MIARRAELRRRRARRRRVERAAITALVVVAGLSLVLEIDLGPGRGAGHPSRPPQSRAVSPALPATSSPAHRDQRHRQTNVYAGIAPGDWSARVRGVPERVYVHHSLGHNGVYR
jgi:hypothetical protein